MRWRARILVVLGMMLLAALSFSTGPYWTSRVQPHSHRGKVAARKVARDTPGEFAFRAVVGGAAGAVAGMLGFLVKDQKRGGRKDRP